VKSPFVRKNKSFFSFSFYFEALSIIKEYEFLDVVEGLEIYMVHSDELIRKKSIN
jgi:hypothetical protein